MWTTVKIKDLGKVVTGSTPPTSNPENFGPGYPFIKPPDLHEDRRKVFETETEISEIGAQTQSNRVIPEDTPCIVCIGTIGKMGFTTRPSFTNQQINSVIVDRTRHDPAFVYYLLRNTIPQVKQLNGGSASGRENVNKSSFENIEVNVPPIGLQHRIARILSAYDELIENNEQRIKILEEMARSLYREWFVNFRSPGQERNLLVDSPLGPIPKGWEVKKLGDIVGYNRRATKRGPHLDERRYVPIDCLPSKSLALLEAKPIEEAQSSLQLFEKGDILFGAMRPYFHKVVVAPFAGVTRTTCFVFKPARPEWHAFATMTAFEETTVAYATAHSQGATIPYAVWDGSLAEMPLVLAPDALLRRFEKVVAPILAWISQSFFALNNLRWTRDLLLPSLVSGQVNLTTN